MNIKKELNNLNQNSDKSFNLALIFTCVILFIYCYFGSFSFFEQNFSGIANLHYWKIIYHNCMSFVLFFALGLVYTKFVMKQNLSNYGLKTDNKKFVIIIMALALIICPIVGLSSTLDASMQSTYPLIDFNNYGFWRIAFYFFSYLLYYIGWEYLFRGLLFFSARKKCGALGAILVTTLISALIHTSIAGFGKPMIETLSAIPAGIIFGYLAHKSNSIYPSLFCHALIGFFTDIFIFLLI